MKNDVVHRGLRRLSRYCLYRKGTSPFSSIAKRRLTGNPVKSGLTGDPVKSEGVLLESIFEHLSVVSQHHLRIKEVLKGCYLHLLSADRLIEDEQEGEGG